MARVQWHRKQLTPNDGEYILWHVLNHIQETKEAYRYDAWLDSELDVRKLLQAVIELRISSQ